MRFAPLVLRLMGPGRVDAKRRRIDMAGNPGGLTLDRYAARRAVYGAFGVVWAWSMLSTASSCWRRARAGLRAGSGRRRASGRRSGTARTSSSAPCPTSWTSSPSWSRAGLGFRQALDRVAEKYEGPWADELRITLRQMDMGVSRRQAFDELRRRNASEQVAQFVSALQQGEELGSPIAETLIQIATDMRRTDAQNARRRAAKTVPKATMVVTLVFMLPGDDDPDRHRHLPRRRAPTSARCWVADTSGSRGAGGAQPAARTVRFSARRSPSPHRPPPGVVAQSAFG